MVRNSFIMMISERNITTPYTYSLVRNAASIIAANPIPDIVLFTKLFIAALLLVLQDLSEPLRQALLLHEGRRSFPNHLQR